MNRYDPDLLLGYIEDELGDEDRARFEQHMAEDDQLAALVQGLMGDRALLRSIPDANAPSGLVDDAMHRLERSMLLDGPAADDAPPIPIQRGREILGRSGDSQWGRALGLAGLAAAVLIGAGVTWLVIQDDPLNETARDLAEESAQSPPPTDPSEFAGTSAAADPTVRERSNSPAPMPTEAGQPLSVDSTAGINTPRPETPERERAEPRSNGLLDRVADALAHLNTPDPATPEPPIAATARQQPPADAVSPDQAPVVALADNDAWAQNPAPQLFVLTDSPALTKQQIVAWCLSNGVPVVETQGLDYAYANEQDAVATLAGVQGAKLALLIEAEQLGELVTDMNTNGYALKQPTRQRAELNTATVTRQRAQVQAAPAAGAAGLERSAGPANDTDPEPAPFFAQLRAPADLGSEELTRQNYDNVMVFNNRVALEQQKLSPQPYGPVADADNALAEVETEPLAHLDEQGAPSGDGEGQTLGVAEPAPGPAEQPGQLAAEQEQPLEPGVEPVDRADRRALRVQEDFADNAEALESGEEDLEPIAPRPAAPRGNWLSPQLPLATNTPIWSNAPKTQIVPIVLQQVEPAELDRILREELANQVVPEATDAQADQARPAIGEGDASNDSGPGAPDETESPDTPATEAEPAPADAPASE